MPYVKPKTPEEHMIAKEIAKRSAELAGAGRDPGNVHPSPQPEFDPRPIEEQRGILTPSGPDALFNPPTSIDRKYGGKHSQYRGGMPIGQAGRGEGHPGTELPAMVLPGEPGYEEEDPIV